MVGKIVLKLNYQFLAWLKYSSVNPNIYKVNLWELGFSLVPCYSFDSLIILVLLVHVGIVGLASFLKFWYCFHLKSRSKHHQCLLIEKNEQDHTL